MTPQEKLEIHIKSMEHILEEKQKDIASTEKHLQSMRDEVWAYRKLIHKVKNERKELVNQ